VAYFSYRMYSEALLSVIGGTLTSGNRWLSADRMVLNQETVPRLQHFWKEFSPLLPDSFYWPTGRTEDSTNIAYRHYCDALLQDGLVERRIANAIMGLEALFLKPHGEVQELSFRLKKRVSKVLGCLNFDALETERVIQDAYACRNRFAHGGRLSHGERRKLEAEYQSLTTLLTTTLEYLRSSIVASLSVPREKEALIDLVDDSLIDGKSSNELNSAMSRARNVLGLT